MWPGTASETWDRVGPSTWIGRMLAIVVTDGGHGDVKWPVRAGPLDVDDLEPVGDDAGGSWFLLWLVTPLERSKSETT